MQSFIVDGMRSLVCRVCSFLQKSGFLILSRKVGFLDYSDFYEAKNVFYPDMEFEDYERLHWGELFEKIQQEPDNPYNYHLRAHMRTGGKTENTKGAIDDYTQVIKILLADKDKHFDINLYSCYLAICQLARRYGSLLRGRNDFEEAKKYYNLSIDTGERFTMMENFIFPTWVLGIPIGAIPIICC
jgi:tetratricopeptide (TPR) repeat protein